jgi:FAD/FMN-containing dehydrogenase
MDNNRRNPALVMRPRSAVDIAKAIKVARDANLKIAVRSGGHSAR